MILRQQRLFERGGATIGILAFEVDGAPECFTLEDQYRAEKVPGSTRIPAGLYELRLREAGAMRERYVQRFMPWHRGMLELQAVPGFSHVYIHCGNTHENTAGCVLVGDGALAHGVLTNSVDAYRRVYTRVLGALDAGADVYLEVRDEWNFTS